MLFFGTFEREKFPRVTSILIRFKGDYKMHESVIYKIEYLF